MLARIRCIGWSQLFRVALQLHDNKGVPAYLVCALSRPRSGLDLKSARKVLGTSGVRKPGIAADVTARLPTVVAATRLVVLTWFARSAGKSLVRVISVGRPLQKQGMSFAQRRVDGSSDPVQVKLARPLVFTAGVVQTPDEGAPSLVAL